MEVRVMKIEGKDVTIMLAPGEFKTVDSISFPVEVGETIEAFDDGSDGRLMFVPLAKNKDSQIVINNSNTQVQTPVLMKRYRIGKWLYVGLAILLGTLGAHKFALGKTGTGIWYLIFSLTGIPTLIGIIEGLSAACKTADADGNIYFN